MKEKLYEILAPAGSIEQLIAAVNNGCDSVYLGLDSFNARMKAPNFNRENLRQWVDYCHFFDVKVYVAINTSIKNNEFDSAIDTIKFVYLNNVDGVIVTDLALMKFASQLPKPFEVVASTQLNVHDKYGAQFVKNCGATTVVCARETTLDDINEIAKVGLKVECFLHGALCVCQSGQCLFSSIVGGNSGNRGLCAQPCRKYYKSNVGEEGYLLSTKDLCGLDVAKDLVDAGASVFKLEGRNRRPEYSGLVSKVYSDLFVNNYQYLSTDRIDLQVMYNRGYFTDGYLRGDNDDIIYPYQQNHIGVSVGKITKDGFLSRRYLIQGDGLKVFDNGKEYCGGVALESGIDNVLVNFSEKVRAGMTVHLTTSVALSSIVLSAKKRKNVELLFFAYPGKTAKLTAKCEDIIVTVESSEIVQKAISMPTKVAEIEQQLRKTADTYYTITDIICDINDVFMAKSQINALRRAVLEELTDAINAKIESKFCRQDFVFPSVEQPQNKTDHNCVAAICYSKKQLTSANVDYLIYKPQILTSQSLTNDIFYYLDLPSFCDLDYLQTIIANKNIGLVCHNVGQVEFARQNNLPYVAGSGLNIFNDYMANVFDDCKTFVYSMELSLEEIAQFANQAGLTFVDGQLTLMKLVHCPFKVACNSQCDNCKANEKLVYTDELGNSFPIVRRKDKICTFELLNGKKLSAAGRIKNGGRFLVDYNADVIVHYQLINQGKNSDFVESQPYTKGRLYSPIN